MRYIQMETLTVQVSGSPQGGVLTPSVRAQSIHQVIQKRFTKQECIKGNDLKLQKGKVKSINIKFKSTFSFG